MSFLLRNALREALLRAPSHARVIDGDGKSWAGSDLLQGAEALGTQLHSLGFGPGDRLSVALPNGGLLVQWLLACLDTQVAFCPVPAGLAAEEELRRLAELDPRLHVRSEGRASSTDAEWVVGPREERGPSPDALDPAKRPPAHGVAAILWSSGTSGRARAVGLSPDNLFAQATSHLGPLELGPDSRLVNYLSWSHCFGLGVELLPALLGGACLVVEASAGRDSEQLLALLDRVRPTHFYTVPRILGQLARAGAGWRGMSNLRGGVVGGAVLSPALSEVLTPTGWRLRQGYGQTECSPGVTLGGWGDFRPDCLGRPVGCEVKLLESSELAVRGPNVSVCTWSGEPPRWEDGWLCTGDLAHRDGERTLWWDGRRDDCFKLANGRMVNPHLREKRWLESHPGVAEVIVVGAGDERATTLVRAREGMGDEKGEGGEAVALPEELWRQCETPTGKVIRRQVEAVWRAWERRRQ